SELGALWVTYLKKTIILRFLEYFIEVSEDIKSIYRMLDLWKILHPKEEELQTMIHAEGAAVRIGVKQEDVNLDAQRLYENGFDVMFSLVLKIISLCMYALHITISYREDIVKLYMDIIQITLSYYNHFPQYLLEEDIHPRPNYITMPKSVDYITDKNY